MAKSNMPKLGATGEYPKGKLAPDDEGGLNAAITRQGDVIRIDFGKPVGWLALYPDEARALAKILIEKAK